MKKKSKINLAKEVVIEAWYVILVMVYYYSLGIFFSLPAYTKGHKRQVVLVTGFWGRNLYWKRMKNRLIEAGYSVYPVELGFQVGDINKKSKILEKYLEDNNINDCFVIAHSMGGWITLGMSKKAKERIAKLFTLSTSFRGTYVCFTVPMFISSWQQMPLSRFSHEKKKEIQEDLKNLKNIYAWDDEIAIPVQTCHLGNEDEVCSPEFGHMNLVMSKTGLDLIMNEVNKEEEKIKLSNMMVS
jgi:hypothetical protein